MTFGAQDSVLFGSIVVLSVSRLLLYRSRLQLYEKRRQLFEKSQPQSISAGWEEVLRKRGKAYSALYFAVAAYICIGFLFAFHQGIHTEFRQAVLGAILFSALGSFCLESYYSLNRKLVLRHPEAARAAFQAAPRRGLLLEFMIAAYIFLPTMLAFVMAPGCWYLLGGVLISFLVLITKGSHYLTRGRGLAAEAEAMRGAEDEEPAPESGDTSQQRGTC